MHDVQSVGDGIQDDARAAEDAGALADRTSGTLFFAVELEGLLLPLAINLPLALS
jgi:hypothetical protein